MLLPHTCLACVYPNKHTDRRVGIPESIAMLPIVAHYAIPKHWQTHRIHTHTAWSLCFNSQATSMLDGAALRLTPALPVVRHTAACGCVIDCHVASHLLSLRRRQAVITLASKDRQTDRRAVIGSFQRLCHRLRCVISDRIVANCQVASHLLCSRNCQVA